MTEPAPRRPVASRAMAGHLSRRALYAGLFATALLGAACTAEGPDAAGRGEPLAERSSAEEPGSSAADGGSTDSGTDSGGDGGSGSGGSGGAEGATVDWRSCQDDELVGLDCATLEVPLDPDEPDGETIELALARREAGEPERRIGSLLINPGGPGASGVDLVGQLAAAMDERVLDRFDLVGFDPRGVGRSTAVDCIEDKERINGLDGDPDNKAEIDAFVAAQQEIVRGCVDRHAELLPFLSTANAAHDLDDIRAAVGDDKLTYLGFSYGTELGATYATLYPDKVRVMVLDGAVGPNLSDEELSATQAQGFDRAFGNLVAACRTDERCAARPDAKAVYETVRAKVEAKPIPVSTAGEDRQLTVGDFQYGMVSALYDQALWAYLARGLVEAADGDGATMLALADLYHERSSDGTYPNAADANLAINCADSTERSTVADAELAAADYRGEAPIFGAQLGWSAMACNGWPTAAEPVPPIETDTDAPILVIGTVNDPATPYEWAGQLNDALQPASRLLTWEGEGHTAYLKSDCVTEAVDTLLVDLRSPTANTRCPADADRADGAFAGIAPDLRDAFMDNSGLDRKTADCIAQKVSDAVTATDLVALYGGEDSASLEATVTKAAQACASGG